MVILLPLILLVSNAAGEYGVDTSNWGKPWTAAQLACLRQADQRFLIVEAFRRSERVLPDARTTVVNCLVPRRPGERGPGGTTREESRLVMGTLEIHDTRAVGGPSQ